MNKKTKWIKTDTDSGQYGRCLGPGRYEFKERRKVTRTIDLRRFTMAQVLDTLKVYGYSNIECVDPADREIVNRDWIIAECLFEQDIQEAV